MFLSPVFFNEFLSHQFLPSVPKNPCFMIEGLFQAKKNPNPFSHYTPNRLSIMKGSMIKIQVFCWVWIFRHIHEYAPDWQAPQLPLLHWMKHIVKDRNPWVAHVKLPSWPSIPQHLLPTSSKKYKFILIPLGNVNNMPKRRNHIDVNTPISYISYPSSLMVFWKDISTYYYSTSVWWNSTNK